VERLARFYSELFLPRTAVGRDEIYTDHRVRGVASWTPPGQGETGTLDLLRMLPRPARLSGRWLPRTLKTLSTESQFPEAPHWHLPFLGVVSEAQGQGSAPR
jgi:hypothetical protein